MNAYDERDNYNFYIKNKCAFTEDHVRVYKVFVYKIPASVTIGELHDYFARFGKLRDIKFINIKRRRRYHSAPKVAFVHYDEPEVAAKVLQKEKHHLKSKRVSVKACDSWHQPNCQGFNALQCSSDEDSSTIVEASNILILNDDCLENILERLSLRDKMRFSRTCSRFRAVFEMNCKITQKTLDIELLNNLTLWETRDYFDLAGKTIESITGQLPSKNRERIVEYMGAHCINLKTIDLCSSNLHPKTILKMVDKVKTVENLRLHYCSISDVCVMYMRKLPALKKLVLSENTLSGKYICKLSPAIEELSLSGCSSILSAHTIEFCQTLKNLRKLDIEQCDLLSTKVFQEMVNHCLNLESLKFSCCDVADYELIAKLPKLTHLTLYSESAFIRRALFTMLVDFKAEQLEFLHVIGRNWLTYEYAELISRLSALKVLVCANNSDLNDGCLDYFSHMKSLEEIVLKDCSAINNISLLRLMLSCHKLSRVHLENCLNVTDCFVFDLIKKLREQAKYHKDIVRKLPIACIVANTKINEFVLNDPVYLSATDLIKLHFDPVPHDLMNYEEYYADDFNNIDDAIDDLFGSDDDIYNWSADEDDDEENLWLDFMPNNDGFFEF